VEEPPLLAGTLGRAAGTAHPHAGGPIADDRRYVRAVRSLGAVPMTDTELSAIAALAMVG
jgi:hypothetical protein